MGVEWEVHGIDAAAIDPSGVTSSRYREALAGVSFRPRTTMTSTLFSDGYFDLVVGQFALEYADPPSVLAEMRRVLKSGGRAAGRTVYLADGRMQIIEIRGLESGTDIQASIREYRDGSLLREEVSA